MHEPELHSHTQDMEPTAYEPERCQPLSKLERAAICTRYLLLALTWLISETLTAKHFKPSYNYLAFPISDLGIPYPFDHGASDGPTFESPLAYVMNSGFIATGWLYGLLNIALLWRTRTRVSRPILSKSIRKLRYLCSLVVTIGLTLVGLIHGGPREWKNGTIEIHNSAAFFAMLFSHLNSVAAGVVTGQTLRELDGRGYRWGSVVMGVAGVTCEMVYATQPAGLAGLFERLTVYLVLLWVVWNASWIACGFKKDGSLAVDIEEEEPLLT